MFCKISDCEKIHKAHGLCGMHYMRKKRATDPIQKQKDIEINRNWRKNNPDGLAAQQARYRQRHKKKLSEYYKKWINRNRSTYNSYQKNRKKRVVASIPKWACLSEIRKFYYKCPSGFHVDHIVPINGKTVCGLHVIDNLQYLPALENLKKSNRL